MPPPGTASPAATDAPHPVRVEEPGMGLLEIWQLPVDEASLRELLEDVFFNWWQDLYFGILIQGAAWEIRVTEPPRGSGFLDGYLTVDFTTWHFHLCIGETRGSSKFPTPPALARHRRTARAELYRQLQQETGVPNSWGLRLLNGEGEQQLTVFLPNPFLDIDLKPLKQPDFGRLALWDHLRDRWLGLPPDPADRTGKGFIHG